ncbi:MAG TPA: hypothetical protein VGM68_11985 [Rhizomicrobium sp.]|jgi:DNA topoisomerase-1
MESPAPIALRRHGLTYLLDTSPGISRHGKPGHFQYRCPTGKPVRDQKTLRRIRALAIPPAWTDVWISSSEKGHLAATGRDARGRKQYRYHPYFVALRDRDKFDHLLIFAKALPRIKKRARSDIRKPGLSKEKILAAVILLLDETLIRIGNEDYARDNGSYGLTTLLNRHVKVKGPEIRFLFRGKSGRQWSLSIRDPRIAKVVRACQELPGQHLFEYRSEDGQVHAIGSADVNAYLQEISGDAITAKDFRTWAGTLLAAKAFSKCADRPNAASVRKIVAAVADQLGNTVAVCRRCYIHPAVISAFLEGRLVLNSAGFEQNVIRFLART